MLIIFICDSFVYNGKTCFCVFAEMLAVCCTHFYCRYDYYCVCCVSVF